MLFIQNIQWRYVTLKAIISCTKNLCHLYHISCFLYFGYVVMYPFYNWIKCISSIFQTISWWLLLKYIYTRKQLSVKLCFALTINKSQGQLLTHVDRPKMTTIYAGPTIYCSLKSQLSFWQLSPSARKL